MHEGLYGRRPIRVLTSASAVVQKDWQGLVRKSRSQVRKQMLDLDRSFRRWEAASLWSVRLVAFAGDTVEGIRGKTNDVLRGT